MRAKDIMTPVSDCLTPETSLKDAAKRMKAAKRGESETGVKGMAVLDQAGKLAGMVSMGDILKAVIPFYMSLADVGDLAWEGMCEDIAKRLTGKTVGDIMTRDVITVEEDAPLMECVEHMVKNKLRMLPVLDKAGDIKGMLYERDIFFAIVDAMEGKNGGAA